MQSIIVLVGISQIQLKSSCYDLMRRPYPTILHPRDSNGVDNHGNDTDDAKYDVSRKQKLHEHRNNRRRKNSTTGIWNLLRVKAMSSSPNSWIFLVLLFISSAGFTIRLVSLVGTGSNHSTPFRKQHLIQSHRQQHELDRESFQNRQAKNNQDAHHNSSLATPERQFDVLRRTTQSKTSVLKRWLQSEDAAIVQNRNQPYPKWIRHYLLPPLPEQSNDGQWPPLLHVNQLRKNRRQSSDDETNLDFSTFFKVSREGTRMAWEEEYAKLVAATSGDAEVATGQQLPGPRVDYTRRSMYHNPSIPTSMASITDSMDRGEYPKLVTLSELMEHWPQDSDYDQEIIEETLFSFNFSDPQQLQLAKLLRDSELPFKLYDIPEVDAATVKWNDDEYVASQFGDGKYVWSQKFRHHAPYASGLAQESTNNYFAFFVPKFWDVETMGLPPTRNNDWGYAQWARHARYADAVALNASQPHFYWQAGVPPEERYEKESERTFISRDLPSFSSTTANFLQFQPESQKGIQCRFGERGVVAATHFDGGRNMVAMVVGAKRYILSPPNQCSKLGIFTDKRSPIYRHSLLNFGHLNFMKREDDDAENNYYHMSEIERKWLERAGSALALETVLKQGEILYIPSHWFHYIVSLQKSAQCNVRSGIEVNGNPRFGGRKIVEECQDEGQLSEQRDI
jgi:hypothetical protein